MGAVTNVLGPDSFTDASRTEADGWYDYGVVRWVRGANAGSMSEVKVFSAGQFVLFDRLRDPIVAGDIYRATAGCDKRAVTCKNKFQNFENFRGETAIPGTDSLYNYPGLK
jgi:uncharacterized phage protein (TIGR02218 family)